MAINLTKNYGLKKTDENEFYDERIPNYNMDVIDGKLKDFEDGKEGLLKDNEEITELVDAAALPIISAEEGNPLKRFLWSNFKKSLKAEWIKISSSLATTLGITVEEEKTVEGALTHLNESLSDKEGLIKNASTKTTLVDSDALPLSDSATSNATKKITFANLKTLLASLFLPLTGGTLTGALHFGDATSTILRSGNIMDFVVGNTNMRFNSANGTNGVTIRNVGSGAEYRVYHEGFPPPSGSNVVSGSYTGDGVAGRVVNVGFTPKLVICSNTATVFAIILNNTYCTKGSNNNQPFALYRGTFLTSVGFMPKNYSSTHGDANLASTLYSYIAIG